jgi:hypothetical protein
MNPCDISKECEGNIRDTLCYPVTKHIANYLSLEDAITGNFSPCSSCVGTAFYAASDSLHPTGLWVAGLLERGVRALIYVGEHDWICVSNARWVAALDWPGAPARAECAARTCSRSRRCARPGTWCAPCPWRGRARLTRAGPVRQAEGEPRGGAPLDQGRGGLSVRVQCRRPSGRQAQHVRHVLHRISRTQWNSCPALRRMCYVPGTRPDRHPWRVLYDLRVKKFGCAQQLRRVRLE